MKSFNEWMKENKSYRCECENIECDHGNEPCARSQERFVPLRGQEHARPMCDICAKNLPPELIDHEKIARHDRGTEDLKRGVKQHNKYHGTDYPVE